MVSNEVFGGSEERHSFTALAEAYVAYVALYCTVNFVIGLPHNSAVECKFKDLNQLWIIQTLCKWHTATPGNPGHELKGYSILICNSNYYSRFSTSLLTHLYKEKASADLPWFNSESPRFCARRKQNLSDKKQVSKV